MHEQLSTLRAARQNLAKGIAQQTAALAELDKQIEMLSSVPDELPDMRYTAQEVMRMFKFSPRTLYNRINEGKFPAPATRSGRRWWTRKQIEALIGG